MDMLPPVSYTPYTTYSKEQTGDIIRFAPFQEGDIFYETQNLLSETCDDTKSGNKCDDDSTMPPLICEEEMDEMSSGYDSDAEPMSTVGVPDQD